MNREIKFRGFQPEQKKWYYGCLIKVNNGGAFIFNYDGNFENRVLVNPETVGQYTDLKDKNGVEIYEGDIVSFGSSKTTYKVFWQHDGWMCISNNGDDYGPYTHRLFINTGYFKKNGQPIVLGNLHQNPELLNQ